MQQPVPFAKKDVISSAATKGFRLEADEAEEGRSELEIVVRPPIEESEAGLLELTQIMDDITKIGEGLTSHYNAEGKAFPLSDVTGAPFDSFTLVTPPRGRSQPDRWPAGDDGPGSLGHPQGQRPPGQDRGGGRPQVQRLPRPGEAVPRQRHHRRRRHGVSQDDRRAAAGAHRLRRAPRAGGGSDQAEIRARQGPVGHRRAAPHRAPRRACRRRPAGARRRGRRASDRPHRAARRAGGSRGAAAGLRPRAGRCKAGWSTTPPTPSPVTRSPAGCSRSSRASISPPRATCSRSWTAC